MARFGRLEQVRHVRGADSGNRGQQHRVGPGGDAGVQRGGRAQQHLGAVRQPVQPPLEHHPHAAGQQRVVDGVQPALGPQQPDDLGGEERVAPGPPVQDRNRLRPEPLPGGVGQGRPEVAGGQPAQHDPPFHSAVPATPAAASGSVSRYVPSTSTGAAPTCAPSASSSFSDGGSAQCTSSSTSSTGATSRSARPTASNSRKRASSGSPACGPAKRFGPAEPSSSCAHGQYGGAPPSARQAAHATVTPSARSPSATSATRQVLPIPASPAMSATDGR